MNEIKLPIYKKHKDKNIQYTKSLDKRNRTIHEYDIRIVTNYRLRISEPTIRRLCMIISFIFGVITHIFYAKNDDLILKYTNNIRIFFFNLTPFARTIMNNTDFKYVFNISIILTLLVSILSFCIIQEDCKNIILSLIVTFIFLFIYSYLNFAICHLIIKIPVYYKILSVISIIFSNIIIGFICISIEDALFR